MNLNPFREGRRRLAALEVALAEVEQAVTELRAEVDEMRRERTHRAA